jgi:hypothetical protein
MRINTSSSFSSTLSITWPLPRVVAFVFSLGPSVFSNFNFCGFSTHPHRLSTWSNHSYFLEVIIESLVVTFCSTEWMFSALLYISWRVRPVKLMERWYSEVRKMFTFCCFSKKLFKLVKCRISSINNCNINLKAQKFNIYCELHHSEIHFIESYVNQSNSQYYT